MSNLSEEVLSGSAPQIMRTESDRVYEEVKRLRAEQDQRRETSHTSACYLLTTLILLLVLAAASYIVLHWYRPPATTRWRAEDLVQLDPAGRVRYLSEQDIRWYLGREQAAALVANLKDRSQQIDQLEDRVVRQSLLEFQVRFSSAGDLSSDATKQIDNLAKKAEKGDFSGAAALLTHIVSGWTDEARKFVGENSIFDLNYGLKELARLKAQQTGGLSKILQPPLVHQIFWMSPKWALLEAIYWSVFGTLVNLLVNISQARADGRFTTDERWISLSKIVYGPILSCVLILAIYFGLLDPGTEIRFWFLPLAGFLFGYNTRKTAVLIDKLSAKLLGATEKSINQIGQLKAQAAAHAADAVRAKARPRNFGELKQQAVIVADTATTAAILNQQSKK